MQSMPSRPSFGLTCLFSAQEQGDRSSSVRDRNFHIVQQKHKFHIHMADGNAICSVIDVLNHQYFTLYGPSRC